MNETVTVERSVAERVLSESRAFATAQQTFEVALRGFVADNDTLTNSNLSALREYLTAKAAGENPDALDILSGLDTSSLERLAGTARTNGQTLAATLESTEIADAAGAASIVQKIIQKATRNHDAEDVNSLLDISGANRYETVLEYAVSPDLYNRDAARTFINEAYQYQEKAITYQRALDRFAERNDIAAGSAEYRELDQYLRTLPETGVGSDRSPLITRLAEQNGFSGLRSKARELNAARGEFTQAVASQARVDARFAGKAPALMASIESLSASYDDENPERIMDSVIDRTIGAGTASSLREAGWPGNQAASYEGGRFFKNLPSAAGNWFTDLFSGLGGDGEGNGLPWQGLLGGLLGGGGGFLIGRMFGGGIVGTIASAALGIMGAYMGANFANRHFGGGNDNEQGSGRGGATGARGTIPMPGLNGETVMLTRQEHLALMDPGSTNAGAVLAQRGISYNAGGGYRDPAPVGMNIRTDNVSLQF